MAIAKGRSEKDLEDDTTLAFALLYGVQTVGEAAAKISEEGRLRFRNIPWPKIISMRNRLVHGYDSVDHGILWRTVCESLPPLIEKILKIIPPEQR